MLRKLAKSFIINKAVTVNLLVSIVIRWSRFAVGNHCHSGLLMSHVSKILFASLLAVMGWGANAKDHIVEVVTDNENGITSFRPKFLMIQKGDTVTWVNKVTDLHNVITYPDGFPANAVGFESPYLEQAGESWSYTFEIEGTYQYHCIPHVLMGMRGVVTVSKPTASNKFHKPGKEEIIAYRNKLLEFFDSDEFGIMPDAVRRNVRP